MGESQSLLEQTRAREFDSLLFKKYLKKHNIVWYAANNLTKAGNSEITIRTIKRKLWKVFSWRGSFKYLDILQDLVSAYNNSVHSRTHLAPAAVGDGDEYQIWSRHYKSKVSGHPPCQSFV